MSLDPMSLYPMSMAAAPNGASLPFHSHPSVILVLGSLAIFFWWDRDHHS